MIALDFFSWARLFVRLGWFHFRRDVVVGWSGSDSKCKGSDSNDTEFHLCFVFGLGAELQYLYLERHVFNASFGRELLRHEQAV